jgi:iron complex outermembrane receptor protein
MTREIYRQTLLALAAAAVYYTPGALAQSEGSADPFAIYDEPASEGEAAGQPAAEEPAPEAIAVEPLRSDPEPELESPVTAEASPEATQLDRVSVTGSRISRTDFETAQPILTLTRDDIERTGLSSIGDLLQDLPQAGPALNTLFNNGGNGATEVDLRSLGADRTLVLVNGRRWVGGVSALSTNSTDLNTIPISIIERIDILKDGASAIYGSDAIAGVINIITRKDVTGSDISSQIQITDRGDGLTQAHSFSTGSVSGNTSMFFSVGFVRQEEIRAGDRAISAVPKFGTGLSRGSPGTDHGFFIFVPTPDNLAIYGEAGCPSDIVVLNDTTQPTDPNLTVDPNPGDPVPPLLPIVGTGGALPVIPGIPGENLTPNGVPLCILTRLPDQQGQPTTNSGDTFVRYNQNVHAYNFAPDNYLLTPQERTNIFGQLNQRLSDRMALNVEMLYNIRRSAQELAAFPLQGGGLLGGVFGEGGIDMTNPFNPFGQNIGQGDPATELVGLGAYFRRLNEQGPRLFQQNVDTFRVGSFLEGDFDALNRFVSWDLGVSYTESTNRNIEEGIQNYDRVNRATGPLADCEDAPDGCVPLNVFDGPGTITQEQIDYFAYTGISSARNRLTSISGNIGLDLIELPAGMMGLALGAESREQVFANNPDPLVAAGRSSTNTQTPTTGEIQVNEAYLELAIPLLKDWEGLGGYLPVNELDLSIAGRYSKYDLFDGEPSGKIGLRYKPFDDLLVRTTYSTAFRAPAITELFLGTVESFPSIQDLCSNYNSPLRDNDPNIENIRTNCANDGVPASYTQTGTQIRTQFGGNLDLEPESADSLTFGVVYNPNWLPELNIDVDAYRIQIDQVIQFVGAGQVLNLCYATAPDQRSLCDRVVRQDSGALEQLDARPSNFSKLDVAGVDLTVSYELPVRGLMDRFGLLEGVDLGRFRATATGAFTERRRASAPAANGENTIDLVGIATGTGAIPRWKAQSQLVWALGGFDASYTLRYIHKTEEICDDGFQAATGLFAPTEDPIRSFEELGLCDGRKTFSGIPDSEDTPFRKVGSVAYHNVQFGYRNDVLGRFVLGVNNVFGKKTPVTLSAFANSFDPTLHELDDVVTYLRYLREF